MKILSLFDGISIAQQALKNLGANVMEKIREWFLWHLMDDDEKRIWLRRKAQLLHIENAKRCNFVGHSSDCCERKLL